jgi:hypothetical protein
MLIKTTKSLFRGTYQYKIVLTCAGAAFFRSGDMDNTLADLKKITFSDNATKQGSAIYVSSWRAGIKTQDDLDYALKLQKQLKKLSNIDIRVESPYISIYSNSKADIDVLIKLNVDNVKYVSVPPSNNTLEVGTVIMPKMPFDYRITLGKTTQTHDSFISWAEGNAKLKLTKSCKRDLNKERSWGGTYFYVTGDNNLLLTKMHLGGSINKVERIIKA